jgi:hypothetical protein
MNALPNVDMMEATRLIREGRLDAAIGRSARDLSQRPVFLRSV